ncbi:hypothetical protein ACF3MZ_20560 [Paenibacillaceae bacterium WGS1546]|uniref:hypothetical protein n=1 Tax=Cohnella sp. WGS1546 TaxID=3366810 RepID=UPI00372D735C
MTKLWEREQDGAAIEHDELWEWEQDGAAIEHDEAVGEEARRGGDRWGERCGNGRTGKRKK